MKDTKSWKNSKGVWGGIIAIICAICKLFDIIITKADIVTLSDSLIMFATATGGVLAVYGRLKAEKKIKG